VQEEQIAYLVCSTFFSFFLLCSCDSANGWFPCFWYLIDLLCSLRFSFVVCGCRNCEGILPSLPSTSTCPCLSLSFSSGFLLCIFAFFAVFYALFFSSPFVNRSALPFIKPESLPKNQSPLQSCIYRTVNQSTSEIVGKRNGPWSDRIAAIFPVE